MVLIMPKFSKIMHFTIPNIYFLIYGQSVLFFFSKKKMTSNSIRNAFSFK